MALSAAIALCTLRPLWPIQLLHKAHRRAAGLGATAQGLSRIRLRERASLWHGRVGVPPDARRPLGFWQRPALCRPSVGIMNFSHMVYKGVHVIEWLTAFGAAAIFGFWRWCHVQPMDVLCLAVWRLITARLLPVARREFTNPNLAQRVPLQPMLPPIYQAEPVSNHWLLTGWPPEGRLIELLGEDYSFLKHK